MPDVKLIAPEDRFVPAFGRIVESGELVKDVDDELAASLAEQPEVWEVRKQKAKPTATDADASEEK